MITTIGGATFLKTDLQDVLLESACGLVADMESGEILFATRNLEEMFGYHVLGELVGLSVDELVPDGVRPKHAEHRKRYSKSPNPRSMAPCIKVMGKRRDGVLFPVAVSLRGIVLAKHRCVVAFVADLTDRDTRHAIANVQQEILTAQALRIAQEVEEKRLKEADGA